MIKDLKYKPNALDKARFEFSPLGKAFSTGLDKTADGYQEEVVIQLLKDIRDGLAGGVIRRKNRPDNDDKPYRPDDRKYRPYRPDDGPDRPDNDDLSGSDEDGSSKDGISFINLNNNINNKINNVQNSTNNYINLLRYQNAAINEFKKELTDKENLNKEIINQVSEIIDSIKEERSEYYNKYKQICLIMIKR